jgi:hypothetical protein
MYLYVRKYILCDLGLITLWPFERLQIYAMPVFDMLETFLVKKLRFKPGWPLRLIARSLYVGE